MDKRLAGKLLFLLLCAAQIGALVIMLLGASKIRDRAPEVRMACRLYDPYDPLKGRYLRLQPEPWMVSITNDPYLVEISTNDPSEFTSKDIWITLRPATNGLSEPWKLSLARPDKTQAPFVRCRARTVYSGQVSIEWPFDRYYLQEELAKGAEKLLRGEFSEMRPVLVLAVDADGNWVQKALLADGVPVEKWVKERLKAQTNGK